MKKAFSIFLFTLMIVSCNYNVSTTTNKEGNDVDSALVDEENTTGNKINSFKLKDFIDSIITADPNALNNDVTRKKLESEITSALKKEIKENPLIISDIPLDLYNVYPDAALFTKSIELTTYPDLRIDIEISAPAATEVLSTLKDNHQYYIVDGLFGEFSYDWSMNIEKDSMYTESTMKKRKIMVYYRIKNPKFQLVN